MQSQHSTEIRAKAAAGARIICPGFLWPRTALRAGASPVRVSESGSLLAETGSGGEIREVNEKNTLGCRETTIYGLKSVNEEVRAV